MQASKISVAICLGVVSVMPFVVRADDTPQQARLRELLHAAEAGHPYPTETPAPAVTNATMEMPATTLAPAMTPPPAPATPDVAAPAAPVVETPAAPAAPTDATMTPPAAPAMPDAATPAPPAAPAMEMPAVAAPAAPAEPAMTPPAADGASPVVVTPPSTDMSTTDTNAPAMQSGMTNAEAQAIKQAQKPAPVRQRDLTPDQRQRLDALTTQYKADQLSPEQYHEQRAKILAEP